MGSGKTQKSIKIMNEGYNNYIYITPFLSEVERIKNSVTNKKFYSPEQRGGGKLTSLKDLIKQGKNVASTHALFSTADDELKELLKMNNYVLILDEVMEVVSQVNISSYDINLLIHNEQIVIDEFGKVLWNKEKYGDYKGKFEDLMVMALHDRLIMANKTLMLWMFPADIFSCFEEVYILTYMFDGQIMKYYYDLYNIKYEYLSVRKINGDFEFVEYNDDKSKLINLINISEDIKLNSIGNDKFALSYSWYDTALDSYLEVLKKNITNFFINKCKAKSKEVLWTTFLGDKDCIRKKLQNKGYQSINCFAPMNSRATNEYRDRKYIAYTVNRFINPYMKAFFNSKGIEVNEDKYALSEMLQFIFRSAIRCGESINIYIPSKRMRNLLKNWIEEI